MCLERHHQAFRPIPSLRQSPPDQEGLVALPVLQFSRERTPPTSSSHAEDADVITPRGKGPGLFMVLWVLATTPGGCVTTEHKPPCVHSTFLEAPHLLMNLETGGGEGMLCRPRQALLLHRAAVFSPGDNCSAKGRGSQAIGHIWPRRKGGSSRPLTYRARNSCHCPFPLPHPCLELGVYFPKMLETDTAGRGI
jgi:hypothetical protein